MKTSRPNPSGKIWMLRYDGANTVPVGRLSARSGISAFGIDPASGDVLLADQNGDTVKRLVSGTGGSSDATLPPTLADTGAFRDLASLTPNPGIVPYDINVPFWSDNARKRRWFSVPDCISAAVHSAMRRRVSRRKQMPVMLFSALWA